jgi:hypothetical protein
MIQINENEIVIDVMNGKLAIIDGQTYELVDGKITIANRSSAYDIVVYGILEENHIERPIVIEPEIIFEEQPIEEEIIVEDPENV